MKSISKDQKPTSKKSISKKESKHVVTAFSPQAKIPKGSLLWYFQLTDIDGKRRHAVAVIFNKKLHSAEWEDGEIINMPALKKLNKFNAMYSEKAIEELWNRYGLKKKE